MRKPSIYIASNFANKDMVSGYLDRLRDAGFHITHDWTKVEVPGYEGRGELEIPVDIQRVLAADDARGVVQADLLWVISPEKPLGTGCWVELGLALNSRSCFVVISGPARSIFQSLCQARFETHEEAFEALLGASVGGDGRVGFGG